MRKKKTVGSELVKAMKQAVEDLKNDVPMKTTTYERQKDGSMKRTVAMLRPSELRRKK